MTLDINLDLEQNLYDSAIKIAKKAGDLVKKSLGSVREVEQKKNASDRKSTCSLSNRFTYWP
jgi:hypothetical protein